LRRAPAAQREHDDAGALLLHARAPARGPGFAMTPAERTLAPAAAPAAASANFPEQYGRPLFFFNAYRLIIGLLLLLIVAVWGNTLTLGSYDMTLFVVTDVAYVFFSMGCFGLISARWHFNLLLTAQVAADIGFIVVLMFASGGISSGLGLLLLTALAGA